MEEYIIIPNWINNIHEIKSENLKEFFEYILKSEDNKIDIEYLRKYYKESREINFRNVIDELALRGFEFKTLKSNNILPKVEYCEEEELIFVSRLGKNFVKIDFKNLNLGNFIERFRVKDDLFFNKIPYKGFRYLNPNVNNEILKKEFKNTFNSRKNKEENFLNENIEIDNQKDFLELVENPKLKPELDNEINSINYIFKERKFEMFREFCNKKELKYIYEINNNTFISFQNELGVGSKKLYQVKEFLEKNITPNDIKKRFELMYNKEINLEENILKEFGEITVSRVLKVFNINLNIKDDIKIEQLNNRKISQFIEINENYENENLEKLIDIINKLESPSKMIKKISFNEKEYEIFEKRFLDGMTYEKISKLFGVTRERIRQILEKIHKNVFHELKANNFLQIIKLFFPNRTFIEKEELIRIITSKNINYIYLFNNYNNEIFYYYEPLELYFFKDISRLINEIKNFINKLPDYFYLFDFLDEIIDLLSKYKMEDIKIEDIENLLMYYGFIKYNECFSRIKMTVTLFFSIVFDQYITEPIYFNEEGLLYLKKIGIEFLNYKLTGNIRSLEGRIRDNDEIVLVGPKTFLNINRIKYDLNILAIIDKYLLKKSKQQDKINAEEIFSDLKDILIENNIKNKQTLYSIIKYNYEEKYNIGKGNTLDIFLNDNIEKLSKEEQVVNIVRKYNNPINKEIILRKLNWKLFKLEDTISKSSKIISWGRNLITLIETIKITKDQKRKLNDLLNQKMENGFTTSHILLNELRFDSELNKIIKNNNIENSFQLASIIKNIFTNIGGRTLFLYKLNSGITSIEKVIKNKFTEILLKEDLKFFLEEYGYKSGAIAQILGKLLKKEIFVEISREEIILKEKLNIPNDVYNKVKDIIEDNYFKNEYLSLHSIEGYRKILPKIQYKWNPHLLGTILKNVGYRKIEKSNGDYRYNKIIIVREDSHIKTFEDLVYHILEKEYNGIFHELKVYDFLVEKKIINGREYIENKKLPLEIKKSEIIKIDKVGRIELVK
ncbi:sigma-70-like protein [Hypnocyclicus thermotrophus]|uniref:Sigma-70-like protein n=1 Tax=Hypnocyclicus thermotrophus TaxID=1627895 RepID=A0AA46E0D3_9FUSO|nr:sigma factor-like helix-turn-helix DNA-binding protein [Hypnocyclicus thermotrophus]TDT72502.1 sigma-70-like protein [Hypnocyclicus thermotrophus]